MMNEEEIEGRLKLFATCIIPSLWSMGRFNRYMVILGLFTVLDNDQKSYNVSSDGGIVFW